MQNKRTERYSGAGSKGNFIKWTLRCLVVVLVVSACKTTKKKDDISGLGMLYQNMTAHYNGYFNATEIMKESVVILEDQYQENYNQLLPVYEYAAVEDPKAVAAELDEAIKKASVGISIHRPSKWTDDNYLLIGQAQFMKKDFESAQKTLEYMVNNFDETGKSKEKTENKRQSKQKQRAERAKQLKEKNKEIEERRKEQKLDRKAQRKAAEQEKKERDKQRKQEKKAREKERKQKEKERAKERKARQKARKKGKKLPPKKSTPKVTTENDNTESKTTSKPGSDKTGDKPEVKKSSEEKEESPANEIEEAQDEKEKKEEPKDGALAHKPAYPSGLLWLAKTYVERDFITQADRYFRQAQEASKYNDDILEDLYPSKGHFYIYIEEYEKAIPELKMAIEHTKNRDLKARYAFIIGQLYMRQNSGSQAAEYFDLAAKWSRDYEMEFNAKMNSKVARMSSTGVNQQIIADLEKLLKDEKNAEYKDQIYFQIAKIYLKADDQANAQKYLKLALDNTAGNNAQKTEIHYALGDIYYDKDDYANAYTHYSQALGTMPKSDSRYYPLEKRSQKLKGIADQMDILFLQDSLLMLASLSDEELKERAAAIMKEREEKMKEAQALLNKSNATGRLANPNPVGVGPSGPIASSNSLPSSFFAYNEKELRKGEREFQKSWNSRPLVDDWRRKEVGESSVDEIEESTDPTVISEPTSGEVEDIFKNLPRTEDQKKAVHAKIANALYKLGTEYRNKLERLDLSTETFERFVSDYPNDERVPEAYYFLFLNARDINDNTAAQKYANILSEKFPGSTYALIASDPSYIKKLEERDNSLEEMYAETYQAFETGDYYTVYQAFDIARNRFGSESKYISKLALLQAMSVGKLEGKEKYIEALRTVVAQYPNTTEQIRAREIIRFLSGDEMAFEKSWDDQLIITSFKTEFDQLHYVLVVIHNSEKIKMDEVKISINNYNQLFHKLEKFSIRSFIVDRVKKTPAVLIRKFDDKDDAMQYYDEVKGRMKEFLPEGVDSDIYAISQNNYREMIKSGGVDGYIPFFRDNYLRE